MQTTLFNVLKIGEKFIHGNVEWVKTTPHVAVGLSVNEKVDFTNVSVIPKEEANA